MSFIPFHKTNVNSKSLIDFNKLIKSGWITFGKISLKFEQKLKKFVNSKYVSLVSSNTAGLHLSLLASGIKKDDYVIFFKWLVAFFFINNR